MKNLIFRPILSLLCLAPMSPLRAQPQAYQGVLHAEMDATGSERYLSATLDLDGRKRTIDLTLQGRMPPCQEGFLCAQLMPEPLAYQLKHALTRVDRCGIIRTVARFDQRPVDGIFLELTINNNRNNTCPTLMALPAIDMIVSQKYYDRLEGREVHELDTFAAQDFALIKVPARDWEL